VENGVEIDRCQYRDDTGSVPTSPALLPVVDVTACCAPLDSEPLARADAEALARVLKALADPARLQLVSHIASSRGEVCACDLGGVVGLAQPTVSHHLKVLVDTGILSREKRGVWAYYRAVPGALGALGGLLREGWTDREQPEQAATGPRKDTP
jgi:ArsR family transcriptional regulator, arsenate/arsenite/antimonite-responsive transcriptional repressor